MSARLGVFGGTFDPPHLGHLALAESAREQLALDRVIFMPAGEPPHKRGRRLTPARHRLAMARLAVRGNKAFEVSSIEARRSGPSYTVDTLRAIATRAPHATLFLLLGADSLDDFPTWRDPRGILGLATLVIASRPGARARRPAPGGGVRRAPARGSRPAVLWLANPGLDVSSTAIRARAAQGASLRYLVPDAVSAYIGRHRLYRRRS